MCQLNATNVRTSQKIDVANKASAMKINHEVYINQEKDTIDKITDYTIIIVKTCLIISNIKLYMHILQKKSRETDKIEGRRKDKRVYTNYNQRIEKKEMKGLTSFTKPSCIIGLTTNYVFTVL